MGENERRASERHSIRIPITFRYKYEDVTEDHSATVENVSYTGLLLHTEGLQRIPRGRIVMMIGDECRALGRVSRSAKAGIYGVAFLEMDDETTNFVRAMMERAAA